MGVCVGAVALAVELAAQAGSGPPRFVAAPGSPIRVAGSPSGVITGDLNRDGRPDLVAAVGGTSALSVLLGDGRGGFSPAPGSPLPVAPAPHLVEIGDLDRDGKPDLVATSHDSHGVFVWLGDGTGRFRSAAGSPYPALAGGRPHNHGLALGDVDRDGALDVATTDDEAHVVAVLLGDGRGGFRPASRSPFGVGRQPYPLALADLNGDGRLDIVTPDVESGTLSVLLGDGRGGFERAEGSPIRVTARPYSVAVGDLAGDATLDAVTTHDDVSLVTVLRGDGRGGFRVAPGSPVDVGRRAGKAVIRDLNRDGKSDLVLGSGHGVIVMLGDGRGGFAPAPGSPLPTGRGSWSVAVGDFDGDGRADVATADVESGSISVLLQQ
ncbi:MAG TPA: VCBS repeat-containing protein [Vicinamibacteria bacterium]|nr:VCBS repeat-containing protein [Vicinamibacteria bacterium]